MRILIAMSGGVDSAAAAATLLSSGHTAVGCTMRLSGTEREAREVERAAATATVLGIPHRVLDLRQEFYERVILPFAAEYASGRTPNPCILCNHAIKFGLFYDYAMAEGFDRIATGHYARIGEDEGGYHLQKAADPKKDQSYVLYRLSAPILARTLLPLGEMTKDEARGLAARWGLAAARAEESQDICFVPNGSYAALVEKVTGRCAPLGHYVDRDGRILGEHRGITHYTLGQHKGLGIALGRVQYVTHIDPAKNRITLGDEAELFKSEILLRALHLIEKRGPGPFRANAKLRYRQSEEPLTVYPEGEGARLVFDRPQRAPTPGQSAVLYDGDTVLGGGIIM